MTICRNYLEANLCGFRLDATILFPDVALRHVEMLSQNCSQSVDVIFV